MIPRWFARCLYVIPWLLACAGLVWFLSVRFPPSGIATFGFAVDGSSPWMDRFLPGERAYEPQAWPDGWTGQRIIADPVYASLRVPGLFDSVDVALDVRPTRQPLIEMGIVRSLDPYAVEMHPVWSEALARGWREVTVSGVHGYVRADRPDRDLVEASFDKLMTWYSTTTLPALQDVPVPLQATRISLRGSHDISFIPTSDPMTFTFTLQEVNRSRGGDIVAFRLTRGDELIATEAIGSSGIFERKMGTPFQKNLSFGRLVPGIYKLSLIMDDDVFIRSIGTNARHWVFGPRLYAGDEVGYSTSTPALTVWTNSQHLALETHHVEGRGPVSLGGSMVRIAKTHTPYALNRAATERATDVLLRAPQGDVRIVGDGYIALTKDALFYPQPRRLTDASDPLAEGVFAIRTPYRAPGAATDGSWFRIQSRFTLDPLEPRPKLVIATPGMFPRDGALDVRAGELRYVRPIASWQDWLLWVRREVGIVLKQHHLL